MKRCMLAVVLLTAGCGGGGGGGPETAAAEIPGSFFLVDRRALYDPAINGLSNGEFEPDAEGWDMEGLQGAPDFAVVPRDVGQALRVETDPGEMARVRSQPMPIAEGTERVYLAFEAKTDLGVLDPGWGGVGTEEQPLPGTDLVFSASVVWDTGQATVFHVTHTLIDWRPFLVEAAVPPGAAEARASFLVAGSAPNSSEPHRTYLDRVRLFAEPASVRPRPLEGSGFEVRASFLPGPGEGEGRIVGEAANLTGTDAAIDLVYALPVTAARVDYHVAHGEDVVPDRRHYEDPVSADFYSTLTMSSAPLGSVTTAGGETWGLAVPLEPVRVFQFRYDAVEARFETLFRFGLTPSGSHSTASFEVRVLRTESAWRHRELWRRYMEDVEPSAFAVPRPFETGVIAKAHALFFYENGDFVPAISDPDEFAALLADARIRWVDENVDGTTAPAFFDTLAQWDLRVANYDYPWIFETPIGDHPQDGAPPDYWRISSEVDLVAGETNPPSPWAKLNRLRAADALRDAEGYLKINRDWVVYFIEGSWAVRIPTDLRPGTSEYLETALAEKFLPGFALSERVMGVGFDGFMKETKVLRRPGEPSEAPLTYDPNTGAPVAHGADADLVFLRDLRARLDQEGYTDRALAGNITELGTPLFGMRFLDSAGWECDPVTGANFSARDLAVRRMLFGDRRLGVMFNGEWWLSPDPQATIRRFFQISCLWGLVPNLFNRTFATPPITDPALRAIVRAQYAEMYGALDALLEGGWRPVTHARFVEGADVAALRVERFGMSQFAVLNNPDLAVVGEAPADQTAVLEIDLAGLGLAGDSGVANLYGDGSVVSWDTVGEKLRVTLFLPGFAGAVLRLE